MLKRLVNTWNIEMLRQKLMFSYCVCVYCMVLGWARMILRASERESHVQFDDENILEYYMRENESVEHDGNWWK